MREVIKNYVNQCFAKARAPKSKAVSALKKEVYTRMMLAAKYFVNHGLDEEDAVNAAAKTVTNIRAMIAAAVREERKKEAAHVRIKAVVICIAMLIFIMSPLPVIKGVNAGFIITLGLLAAGTCLLIYAGKSKPKDVGVSEICDRFEIGMLRRRPAAGHQSATQKGDGAQTALPQKSKHSETESDEDYEYNGGKNKSVYKTTSKLLWMICPAAYVISGLASQKWIMSLMLFPIFFSLTRLAKAFTDFFRIGGDSEDVRNSAKS